MAHVVILPFIPKSHIKPMLTIAELLCHSGLRVTFVNIDDRNHQLLQSATNSDHNLNQRLRFMSMTHGLSTQEKQPAGLNDCIEFMLTMDIHKHPFKDFMVSLGEEHGCGGWPSPTCIIADGFLTFAIEAACELNIPVIAYRPNACSVWTFFHVQKFIELGELPFPDDNMDKKVTCIPGMETLLRRRDLPNFFQYEFENPLFRFFIKQTITMARASSLLLNTFHELEAPIIDQLGTLHSKIYTIGPLQELIKTVRTKKDSSLQLPNFLSYKQENRTCLTWLDSQLPKSVIYVAFGSLATMTHENLLEIWYGLVNSGKPFLWVIRQDKKNEIPVELIIGTKERGFIVDWAPQEEVLNHQSIGGFLTHSGWKSTMESIYAGIPMICWPQFADQLVNSRCVSDLWRIGLDMKGPCDRSIVEKMIRDLMVDKRDSIMNSMKKYSEMAQECVQEGGSSNKSLKMLVEDIMSNNLG